MFSKKGDMGIGTLILFIAMILTAAVAAGVLISTTTSLQSKTLKTGKATINEIGTSLKKVAIYAEDGQNQKVDYFYFSTKLSAGSNDIKLNDILLTINTNNISQDYTYNQTIDCDIESNLDNNQIYFGAKYVSTGNNNITGYITNGDIIRLCFKSPKPLEEEEKVKFTLLPKTGSTLTHSTYMPSLIYNKRIYIYP